MNSVKSEPLTLILFDLAKSKSSILATYCEYDTPNAQMPSFMTKYIYYYYICD